MVRLRTLINRYKNKIFGDKAKLWTILLILALVFFAVKCVSIAVTEVFSFDGGQTAQVAKNLANDFRYATSYDNDKLFDPVISTGVTVIVPVAIFFRLFGETFAAGLMVNAIYMILFVLACSYYLINCLKVHKGIVILLILFFLGTPRLNEFGFGLYGEIPMLFYFLLFLIFLHKYHLSSKLRDIFFAGIFLGLGTLTKTIVLISVPAIIFSFLLFYILKHKQIILEKNSVQFIFKEFGTIFTGFIVPIILFEFAKFVTQGYQGYLQILGSKIGHIFSHPGLAQSEPTSAGIFIKFLNHLNILTSYLNIRLFYTILILLITLIIFISYHLLLIKKTDEFTYHSIENFFHRDIHVLLTTTLSFFGWWLLITDLAWERYIFSGYILLEICLVLFLQLLINYFTSSKNRNKPISDIQQAGMIIYLNFLLILCFSQFIKSNNYLIGFKDAAEKEAYQKAGEFIQALPEDSQIFGYGWWEAPVLSFASGRNFDNILNSYDILEHKSFKDTYFVYDYYAYYLDPGGDKIILKDFKNQIVFQNEEHKIFVYKILSRSIFSYDDFTYSEKSNVNYSQINFTDNELKAFTRNVFIEEDNPFGKWAETESAYLLSYNNEEKLKIDLWFDEISKYRQSTLKLDIFINKNKVSTHKLTKGGSYSFIIPIKDVWSDYLEITIICNTTLNVEGDGRPLAFFIQKIELIN